MDDTRKKHLAASRNKERGCQFIPKLAASDEEQFSHFLASDFHMVLCGVSVKVKI